MIRHVYWNAPSHSNVESSKKIAVAVEFRHVAMFCKNQKANSPRVFFGQFLDSVQPVWSTIFLPSASIMSWIRAHQGYAYQLVLSQFDDLTMSSKSLHFTLGATNVLVRPA
ncbi:hypothetical protein TNIN_40591 [Trichonephila inaurata madagascariensis]|uniref:Uncharacterized protein n=1 Tax=Trichonephila inaurata madagascariensis TaxID=2747483 RepID=A0A8X6XX87_9ARAC|nr:hypothetical protein TNIN_40591 [Trichonephila inaurata madagascariensis]